MPTANWICLLPTGPFLFVRDPMSRRGKFNPSPVLQRRRMARGAVAAVLVLGALAVLADHLELLRHRGNDHEIFDQQQVLVVRVVDGDTVRIRRGLGDEEVPVRLLGIDAAEMNYTTDAPPEHFAREATEYLRERVEGRQVTLKLEPLETRDRYNRLLAYLYPTDSENLNLTLVQSGYVYADRRHRHTFRAQFEQAENEARRKGRGLWKDVKPEQMPEWRRRWAERQEAGN